MWRSSQTLPALAVTIQSMHTHFRAIGRKTILVGLVLLLSALPAHTADAAWSRGVRGWFVGIIGPVCRDGATLSWVWDSVPGQPYDGEKSTFRIWQASTTGAGPLLGYAAMKPDTFAVPIVVTASDGITSSHTTYAVRDVMWPGELPAGTPITVEDPQAGGGTPIITEPAATTAVVEDCLIRARGNVSTVKAGPRVIGPTDLRSQTLAVPDFQLRYRVDALPAHGALKLITATLAVGSSFTQADINNGRISYTHNGDEAGTDTFGYSVDGMVRVSLTPDGLDPDFSSFSPKISGNGSAVAFASDASNLVLAGDTNFATDIFKWLSNGQILRLTNDFNGNAPAPPGSSASPAISANGAIVAFSSSIPDLPLLNDCGVGDADLGEHIFSAQEQLSFPANDVTLRRRSVSSGPPSTCVRGNGVSYSPVVGSEGSVLFLSSSDNLLLPASDPDGMTSDVFAHSPMSTTRLLSGRAITTGTFIGAVSVAVGGDGDNELVAFGAADEFVAGDTNTAEDIYARYLRGPKAGQTLHISRPLTATQTDGDSRDPSVSHNGRWVAFASTTNNLIAGDTNNRQDIFLRDVTGNTTVRVSVGLSGTQANGDSSEPVVSGDGRYVAFSSTASNLSLDDTDVDSDVFVYDTQTGQTKLVSKPPTGQPNGISTQPSISDDGHHIAFRSAAKNMLPFDGNNADDVFVRYTGYTHTLTLSIGTKLVFMPLLQR